LDQAQVAQLQLRFRSWDRFILILIGGVTTSLAFLAVIPRWHAYSMALKFDAIMFLSLLVIIPLAEIRIEAKGQKRFGPFRGVINGYVLTLLALTLLIGK
jgi:hypothetical protein